MFDVAELSALMMSEVARKNPVCIPISSRDILNRNVTIACSSKAGVNFVLRRRQIKKTQRHSGHYYIHHHDGNINS